MRTFYSPTNSYVLNFQMIQNARGFCATAEILVRLHTILFNLQKTWKRRWCGWRTSNAFRRFNNRWYGNPSQRRSQERSFQRFLMGSAFYTTLYCCFNKNNLFKCHKCVFWKSLFTTLCWNDKSRTWLRKRLCLFVPLVQKIWL